MLNKTIEESDSIKYREENKERLEKEDLDPKQELDWEDILQKFCNLHKRNYHFICRGCNP